MKPTTIGPRTLLCALLISGGVIATASSAKTPDKGRKEKPLNCEMKFDLEGRSALYETANGAGVITCSDGRRAKISIRTTGGGITFEGSDVAEGTGRFFDARTADELFGSYVPSVVHAGAREAVAVQVLTKGRISLVLAGTGRGVDFGLAFEKFTIDPAGRDRAFKWAMIDTDRD